jgi:tetratricopeptide (TPR) repeat protein
LLRFFIFAFFTINSFALEISINGAKEEFQSYSTFHIKDKDKFLCQESIDDFDVVTEIVCAFTLQPKSKIKDIQNNFFSVTTKVKNNTFFIIIKPFEKIKLLPVIFNLSKEDSVFETNVKLAKHWMIIGYKEKLPFIKKDEIPHIGINFPIQMKRIKLPYVGGLDIKGNPVYVKEVKDVNGFLRIKKLYADKKYQACFDLIEEVQEQFPNSIFNVELLYYKIKTYAQLKDNESVIDMSKIYLREYSADENIPEVLSLLGRAYALMGMNTDADYFFDRLFSEHKDSEFTNRARIYKGNMLEESGDSPKAEKFYHLALNSTEDIDIASNAAYDLSNNLISRSKKEDAVKFTDKIVNAKPDYFIKDMDKSLEMIESFKNWEEYEIAAAVAKAIIDEIDYKDDNYEKLLRDNAIWLSKTNKTQQALEALNRYIKEFEDGDFIDEILVAKDELFFATDNDDNLSSKLDQYSELMINYEGDTIGDKALYEKSKLLLENKMYSDVLGLEESILELDKETYPDTENIIKNSAIGLMQLSLENKECQEVLNISHEYNITLSSEWDDGVYECAMKGGDFQLSKKVASSNLKVKDLDERKKWLYRYIKVDFATGNYSDVISATKELITLIKDDKSSEYVDVYRVLFDTYERLEKSDEIITAILDVEERFGLSYKDLDRYAAVMTIGSDTKDNNIVIKYGTKIMQIQKDSGSNPQSPFVEFTLYQAYMDEEDLNKALDVIKYLDDVELDAKNRARQKYLLGRVYTKLWRDDEAKEAYSEAIKADENSPWAKLAKSSMEIQ